MFPLSKTKEAFVKTRSIYINWEKVLIYVYSAAMERASVCGLLKIWLN